jgi:hypothetical protein
LTNQDTHFPELDGTTYREIHPRVPVHGVIVREHRTSDNNQPPFVFFGVLLQQKLFYSMPTIFAAIGSKATWLSWSDRGMRVSTYQ